MIIGYKLDEYMNYNIKIPVNIPLPKKNNNILLAGKSGSGKSLSVLYYIHNILTSNESNIYIADYKAGQEYEAFEGSHCYASGQAAISMIESYYKFFTMIREKRIRMSTHYTLVIEEYSGLLSWCETQDKTLKNDIMRIVGELLAVGRGLNFGIILVMQRADASYFSSGARDQFQCVINFGRCSAEQFRMLGFSGELHENPTSAFQSGQALVLLDGQESIMKIMVPKITNLSVMYNNIRTLFDRQPALHSLNSA